MNEEYQRYLFVKSILIIYPRNYEYRNIIERWILSIANLSIENRSDPVFAITDIHETINQKMAQELKSKHIITNIHDALLFVTQIIQKTNTYLTEYKTQVDDVIHIHKGTITYKEFSFTIPEPRMKLLLKIATYNNAPDPQYAVAKMVMRYASIGLGSQQWTVPFKNYKYLYNKYNVRIEGFASPINSQLLAVNYTNTKICTIFPDTDHWFNSIGNFFKVNLHNVAIVVNPPFIESILEYSTKICQKLVAQNVITFFIMPHWTDSKAYKTIIQHAIYHTILPKSTYQYYNSTKNHPIHTTYNSIMAVFGEKTNKNYTDITTHFKHTHF